MNQENAYISQVRSALSNNDHVKVIEEISNIPLPPEPTPLIALIYGDSKSLHGYDPFAQTEGEKQEALYLTANRLIKKISTYIQDWDDEYEYSYSFKLQAHYSHVKNEELAEIEYLELTRSSDAKSIKEAVQQSKEWEEALTRKLPIFNNETRACLLITVKPIYEVINNDNGKREVVTSGFIEYGDERDINSEFNNLPF